MHNPPLIAGIARLVALVSHPVLLLILLMSCLWMVVIPSKRAHLLQLRARVQGPASLILCCHIIAGVALRHLPYLVAGILGVGIVMGLLFGGWRGIYWGLPAAIISASLAPVVANDLPPHWFPGHKGKK